MVSAVSGWGWLALQLRVHASAGAAVCCTRTRCQILTASPHTPTARQVVRASPSDVFSHLVQMRRTQGLGVFAGARVLEVIDANTQVRVAGMVGSNGPLLCVHLSTPPAVDCSTGVARGRPAGCGVRAARDGAAADVAQGCSELWGAVRRRVVTHKLAASSPAHLIHLPGTQDGTYIVIYQSTKHRGLRERQGGGWSTPVRVNVAAAGYTVAPLMQVRCATLAPAQLALCPSVPALLLLLLQKYTPGPGVESPESLVTLVLKADMGGFLSGTHWSCCANRLARTRPLCKAMHMRSPTVPRRRQEHGWPAPGPAHLGLAARNDGAGGDVRGDSSRLCGAGPLCGAPSFHDLCCRGTWRGAWCCFRA